MLLRETIERCAACDEVTPHSRRTVAVPKVLGGAWIAAAGWCFLRGEAWWLVGAAFLYASLLLLLRDRERCWSIACVRCRGRALERLRRTKPTLGPNTEIHLP